MNTTSLGNLKKIVGILESLLRVPLLISVLLLLALYFLAIPLGLELFFFGNLSTTYSPSSQVSMLILGVPMEVSLSLAFILLLFIYILCFVWAWRRRISFHKVISSFISKSVTFHLRSSLFALPVLSSLAYTVVVNLHSLQESHGIPTGEPPLPKDPLLAFVELSVSPLTEELVFRVLPMGAFLIVQLLALARARKSLSAWSERLKLSFLTLISPQDAKKMLGLKTIDDSGFWKGISLDEWAMVLFTSALFGFSHYFPTSTWNIGKITSTFIQGLVMGLSYLVYGIQTPILIHWFFNYYLYAHGLATIVHPSLVILDFLNEKLISFLGILGLLILIPLGIGELAKAKTFTISTILLPVKKVEKSIAAKGGELLISIRQLSSVPLKSLILSSAPLALTLAIFVLRLIIVNFPAPEAGSRYYETGFVFDESYYVKAARKLLVGEATNNEHPPLSKAFIMLGILLFGDNPLGWRIFSIMASSISLGLLYRLTLILTRNRAASFSATLLLAVDIMAFNIGQIGLLDASSLMFVLAGSLLFLRQRYDLCGLLFGLASLCKLSAIFALGIIFYPLLMKPAEGGKSFKDWMRLAGRILPIAFVTFLSGLWIYDVGYRVFNGNPLDHLRFMFAYNESLRYENPGDVILPLQWINPLNPFAPIPYHVTTVTEIPDHGPVREYHPIAYYGLYTPLWWSIWAILPISLAQILRKLQRRDGTGPFIFSWIVTNFLPYVVFAYFVKRWVYPFYFCMALPGLYMALSHYPSRSRISKVFLILLIMVQSFWFFVWFPVKPKIVIDFLFMLGLPT